MRGGQDHLGKGWYRLADGLTAALLALELWSILSGLPRFIRYWQSEIFHRSCWAELSNPLLALILMMGIPAIAVLAVCNIWALLRKARLPCRCLYQRTNAIALQILFFPLTLFCYRNTFLFISLH